MIDALKRTKVALARKEYDYTALWALILGLAPFLPDVINWLLNDPMAPVVAEPYKTYLHWIAFAMALWARSIAARKPKEQDSTRMRVGET